MTTNEATYSYWLAQAYPVAHRRTELQARLAEIRKARAVIMDNAYLIMLKLRGFVGPQLELW